VTQFFFAFLFDNNLFLAADFDTTSSLLDNSAAMPPIFSSMDTKTDSDVESKNQNPRNNNNEYEDFSNVVDRKFQTTSASLSRLKKPRLVIGIPTALLPKKGTKICTIPFENILLFECGRF
jgi:hypothetical protein